MVGGFSSTQIKSPNFESGSWLSQAGLVLAGGVNSNSPA
jgi:hypothetical protein